jgi:hypothetical protein
MISEVSVRSLSFLIWQQEGCPDGDALKHWVRAKAQLEAEHTDYLPQSDKLSQAVIARPPISQRPKRAISARVSRSERYSSLSAAATQ